MKLYFDDAEIDQQPQRTPVMNRRRARTLVCVVAVPVLTLATACGYAAANCGNVCPSPPSMSCTGPSWICPTLSTTMRVISSSLLIRNMSGADGPAACISAKSATSIRIAMFSRS